MYLYTSLHQNTVTYVVKVMLTQLPVKPIMLIMLKLVIIGSSNVVCSVNMSCHIIQRIGLKRQTTEE